MEAVATPATNRVHLGMETWIVKLTRWLCERSCFVATGAACVLELNLVREASRIMLEVEAKFQAASPQIFDWIRLPKRVAGYTLTEQSHTSQQDTYFDTATGLFLREGASLRLREKSIELLKERTRLITFKARTDGLYARREFETPITDRQAQMLLNGNVEDIRLDATEAAVRYLKEAASVPPLVSSKGDEVNPILRVENRRETWRIRCDAGCVEVCLDDVRYAKVGQPDSVREYGIELELKKGSTLFLQEIVEALAREYGLSPTFESKYERGATLLNLFSGTT